MGHGTSSGRTESGGRRIGSPELGFRSTGNGSWELDVESWGGGQILDETGSTRDPNAGRGGKVYSTTVWDPDHNVQGGREYFNSLNEAKAHIRAQMYEMFNRRIEAALRRGRNRG